MNFYAITGIINAFFALSFGLFIFLKNRKINTNKIFSLLCFAIAFWSIFYFFWLTANNYSDALFYSRLLMIGAIFIPIIYLHFLFELTGKIKEKRKFLNIGYLIFLFFSFFVFSPFFVKEVTPKLIFNFWPNPGFLYHPFILIWVFYVLYSLFFLKKEINNTSGTKQAQLNYIFIGTIIGYAGGITNYFLWYDIPIAPFGNWTLSVYLGMIFYAIIKYRFLDIRVALSRGFIYLISLSIVITFSFLLMFLTQRFLEEISFNLKASLILIIGILLFHPVLFRFEKIASKYFYYTFYDYRIVLNELGRKLTRILDLGKLSSLITDTLINKMKLDRAVILLRNEKTGEYRIQKNIGFREENGISLVTDNFLTDYLEKTQKPLIYEEISLLIKDTSNEKEKESLEKLRENMKRIEANLCLPLLIKDRIIGMIVLGDKISGDPYFEQDIKLLSGLADQASIALKNAVLYNQVQNFSQDLEKKVDEQTRELKKAYEELKASDEAKSVFISMASHQLRTPLTSLRGYSSMILDGTYGKVPKPSREKIEIILSSTERLIGIVNKLLSISKIDLGKIDVEKSKQDINSLINSCLEEMRAEGEEKGLKMTYKPSRSKKLEALVDADKIKEVITNILENSIHYTDKGRIEVGIRKKENSIIIYVKDTGEGLEKGEEENIFEGFTRGKAGLSKFIEGTGLGLYLSKKYIELHNGKIWAESKGKNKGSTFYIKIPLE